MTHVHDNDNENNLKNTQRKANKYVTWAQEGKDTAYRNLKRQ